MIDSSLVSVRDITEEDVPFILDYWFRSPAGFLEKLAVDLAKMPKETELRKFLTEKIRANIGLSSSKLHALIITCDGKPIGFHTITPLVEGDYGIFHAHIWNPEFRGRGIGYVSYPKACKIFINRFNLKKIVFKTPLQNKAAIRIKEKLGIPCLGEEIVGFSVIKDGTRAMVFELSREQAQDFK